MSEPSTPPLKITYLTAGAAGMICGSCLHDNTLARALIAAGHDVQLLPLYTPIRTDEEDVSAHRVFFGGINMYLQQRLGLFRWLPKWLDRWLDQPWLINWAAGSTVKIDPQQVADLTLSILRGTAGFQRKEIERLVDWLARAERPDVVVLSNILTAGCVPELKRRLQTPVVVTLQGDDIFLRALPQPHQEQALAEICRLAQHIDGFIAHSHYYAGAMSEYLGLDRARVAIVPLGVDTRDLERVAAPAAARPMTIGFLARLAPEKGLHLLADAFLLLKQMPGTENTRLRIAGWLGAQHREYAQQVFAGLRAAGHGGDFEYVGEVDRPGKLEFLASLDVLAVPTTYRDPKGLFVLEALAAGVPVVQPDHGAFPEMIAATGGGLLHRPLDAQHLAERLHELLTNYEARRQLATGGQRFVQTHRNAAAMAAQTAAALQGAINRAQSSPREPATTAGSAMPVAS